jgi:putative ABC transport system ATP-binding protein
LPADAHLAIIPLEVMAEPKIISFSNVSKSYRTGKLTTRVLHEVDFEVERGELVAVVGTSGSGKSTLLNIIGGLDRGYSGSACVVGQDLATLTDARLSRFRNTQVGFVFQQFNLLEHLSCAENVALPAIFAPGKISDASQRAQHALDKVGIGDRAADLPANLSGGQKQRVAIARALFNSPPLLLCDEPTGNLDTSTGKQIIDLFSLLNKEDGITLIIVTHEARVSTASDRVVRLEDGRISGEEGRAGDPGVEEAPGNAPEGPSVASEGGS